MYRNRLYNDNIIRKINLANYERYEDGQVVEDYIGEPYHQCRVAIALGMLTATIKRNFENTAPDEIKVIDIGAGSGYFAKKINEEGYQTVAADFEKKILGSH